jgi:hypothetical protein
VIIISMSEWEGLDGMGEEALREIRPDVRRTLFQAGMLLQNTIKQTLTGRGRTGRLYKVSRKGRRHRASAPGEPPAVLYGALRNSVGHSNVEWDGWEASMSVGPGLGTSPKDGSPDPGDAYARRLEYGGADNKGVMILPRPYMEPSVQKAEAPMNALFVRELGS